MAASASRRARALLAPADIEAQAFRRAERCPPCGKAVRATVCKVVAVRAKELAKEGLSVTIASEGVTSRVRRPGYASVTRA
jgi:uncharacterized protein with PIN domain